MTGIIKMATDTAPHDKARQFRRMQLWAVAFALVFIIGFTVAGALSRGTFAALRQVPWRILPIMLALSSLNYLARGTRWVIFCRRLRLNVPTSYNLLYYIAGFSLAATPGKAGEAVRLWLLNRGHQCRYRHTAALLVADWLADAQAIALCACLSVFWVTGYWLGAALAACLVTAVTLLCCFPQIFLHIIALLYRLTGSLKRFWVTLRRIVRPLQLFASPMVLGASLLLGIGAWFAEGFSLWVVLQALHQPLPILAAMFVYTFSMMVGNMTFLPGGFGGTEATMIGVLHILSVPLPQAIAATAMIRTVTMWYSIGLGLCAMPIAMRISTREAA